MEDLFHFFSDSTNLVSGDTNSQNDVFIRDRTLGITRRVSVDINGNQAHGHSVHNFMSPDGKYVFFESESPYLVAGETGYNYDIFKIGRASCRERV